MLAFDEDTVIGRSLAIYGEWAEHELSVLRQYISPGDTVIDIGANVGTHALAFSHWVHNGKVIAIEGQKEVSAVLAANCMLNHRSNVEVIAAVCSDRGGWLLRDKASDEPGNIGAVSFRGKRPRRVLFGIMDTAALRIHGIPTIRIDDLKLDSKVGLIKLDIEGMELLALRGGVRLLARDRPVLYLEQLDTKQVPALLALLTPFEYRLYWLETQPFNLNNFNNVTENIWWRTETGILGLPEIIPTPEYLRPVEHGDTAPPASMNARSGIRVMYS